VYDGKQQRSVNQSGNPISTSPGGPQFMSIALKTVRDYRSAVDAQSLGQAARILKSNGVVQGSADYIAILDHGAKIVFSDGSFQNKQMLGNDVLLPSDFKRVSPYLNSRGAICLYGCSAGGDPGYLQDIADVTRHRVYGVPVDVLADVNEAMRSPNPLSSTWIYRDPTK
jgi:hypothetical protein